MDTRSLPVALPPLAGSGKLLGGVASLFIRALAAARGRPDLGIHADDIRE